MIYSKLSQRLENRGQALTNGGAIPRKSPGSTPGACYQSSKQVQKTEQKDKSRAVQGFPFIEAAPGHTLPSKGGSESHEGRYDSADGKKGIPDMALLSRAESLIQGVCKSDRQPNGMRDTKSTEKSSVKGNVTRLERFGMAPKAVRQTAVQPICREGI